MCLCGSLNLKYKSVYSGHSTSSSKELTPSRVCKIHYLIARHYIHCSSFLKKKCHKFNHSQNNKINLGLTFCYLTCGVCACVCVCTRVVWGLSIVVNDCVNEGLGQLNSSKRSCEPPFHRRWKDEAGFIHLQKTWSYKTMTMQGSKIIKQLRLCEWLF